MTMADYSFNFGGFVIGNGTPYTVTGIEGLGGTSPLRIQDDNRGYLDGSYSGRDFYDERTVFIDVTVLGSGSTTAQANYKSLQNAFAPQALGYYPDPTGLTDIRNQLKTFAFRLNGNTGDMMMHGRSRGVQTPINADFTYGYIQTRIMLSFPDPRYYTFTATAHSGSAFTVTNAGWAASCPTISIASVTATSGEITDGTIGSTTDGKTHMYFANLLAGDFLDVDLLSRIVYLNFYPSRNILTAASTGWLEMAPNSTATWRTNLGTMTTNTQSAFV